MAGNVVRMRRGRPWSLAAGYRLLTAPPAAFMALFFIWPLGRVVVTSLTGTQGSKFQAYRALFGDAVFPLCWATRCASRCWLR